MVENMSDRWLRLFFSTIDPTFWLGFFLRGSMVTRQNPVFFNTFKRSIRLFSNNRSIEKKNE